MSDFLDNLVTRSFQPELAVQPLAASLFSPLMNAPQKLASTVEQFEDPFALPPVNDQFAEAADRPSPPPARLPRNGEQNTAPIVPVMPVIPVIPMLEDQQRSSFTETQALERTRPQATAATILAEPVIKPMSSAAPIHPTRQLLNAGAVKPEQIAVRNETGALLAEAPPSVVRHAEPVTLDGVSARPALQSGPTTKTLMPLAAAIQPSPAIQREGEITSDRNLSPQPKHISQATHNSLPRPEPGRERIIVGQVTEIVEKTAAATDARMTLIPKPPAKPPLVPNFNARSSLSAPLMPNVPARDAWPPETVINVTIGRIEVRATPPPATKPERQRSAPPVMGLDEYLRQRNGGSGASRGSQ